MGFARFDRGLMLQFHGSVVTSDAGLLLYPELDDALGLSEMASDVSPTHAPADNDRHALAGLFWQSVFGRLAGRSKRAAIRTGRLEDKLPPA